MYSTKTNDRQMTFVFSKGASKVSTKVSTMLHSKVFEVNFEVSKFLSARTFELQS